MVGRIYEGRVLTSRRAAVDPDEFNAVEMTAYEALRSGIHVPLNWQTMPRLTRRCGDYGRLLTAHRPSPLGNPFRVNVDGTREQVIEMHRQLVDRGDYDNELHRALRAYPRDLALGWLCFCAPASCHVESYIARLPILEVC